MMQTHHILLMWQKSTVGLKPDWFVSTWKTDNLSIGSSADTQVALPLIPTGTYDFTVTWGDGDVDHITAYDDVAATHTYSSTGVYEVTIRGTCTGWRFNNGGDKLKLLNVSNWGTLKLGIDEGGYFYGCNNLTVTSSSVLDTSATTNMFAAFHSCTNFNGADTVSWDVSSVTSMKNMFAAASNFNQDIGGWDVSSLQDLERAFNWASSFNQDLSDWDTSSLTDLNNAFQTASSFNQDIGDWDVNLVTDATKIFLNTSLSQANYDALLIGWAAQSVQSGVALGVGSTKYTSGGAAEAARNTLTTTYSWTITDGGAA